MSSYEGVIKKVHQNKTKRWALLMDDDIWYGLGHNQPAAADGDIARFDYEMNNQYRNVVEGTLKVKKGTAPPPKTSGGGKGKSDYQQNKDFWAKKEIRDIDTQKKISFAGAYNTAIALVSAEVAAGVLTIGGAKAAKLAAFSAIVEEEAEHLYRLIQSMPERHDEVMEGGTPEKGEYAPAETEADIDEDASEGGDDDGGDWADG